ncbi:hypothetical protein DR73_1532 [Enterobacteriaceae bacterium ATCC 29904]|nr:hypothetical protein DR73_1532 [Enterobacteriaceae bacterium ATCC 29904]
MAMKESWFQHTECTTTQAEQLLGDYRRRGVKAERSLNPDCITWTVSARLPEARRKESTLRTFRQKGWG